MEKKYDSTQEEFWAGDFGSEYILRNSGQELLSSNIHFFSKILQATYPLPKDFLEVGANIGMNIDALARITPNANFTGIEINTQACNELRRKNCRVIESSILNANIEVTYNFVFSKGVLIHLNPNQLVDVYKKLYDWSNQYILIAEYYNPSPIAITYRGNSEKLFKRDFAGEMLDMFPDLILRDYGFSYHRDRFPQDDITWFLLEKKGAL